MIQRLAQVRLSRLQLALVALASATATAVIAIDGTRGQTPAQAEVLAALRHRGVVVHSLGTPSGSAGDSLASSPSLGAVPSSVPLSPGASSAAPSAGPSAAPAGTAAAAASPATLGPTPTGGGPGPLKASKASKVKHVFVITLSSTSYAAAFGRGSVAQYLNRSLVPKGTLLRGYRSLGHSDLPDAIAMVSGQAPNADTSGGCATYSEFAAGAKPDAGGLVPGDGCVYPVTALTVGDQVTGAGKVWKAYLEDMGTSTCVHPASGAADDTALPGAGSEYDTRHNPFIYFHSLLDLGDCAADDESLTKLPGDLSSARNTPTYAFLAPGLCDGASQSTCLGGAPAGLAGEDAFLKRWVPSIMRSAAYRHGGALIIAFTISSSEPSPSTGATGPTGPTGPSAPTGSAPGPGHAVPSGALVLSPYAAAGRTLSARYDPYSVLRTVEDLLGFETLGHAKQARSFAASALPGA